MAHKPIFPDGAFEKEKSSFLSRLFKQRVYEADDILNIRTSFYLENLHNQDTALCYSIKWASAGRDEAGNFALTTNRIDVKDDKILKKISYNGHLDDDYTYCNQEEIIERLHAMDKLLRHKATIAAPQLSPPPIYIHDSIHLSVAQEIFDHACKKDEVEYHLQRIENIKPQKIKFG